MPNITPQQMLTLTANYADNIRRAKKSSVAVGLPSEKVGDKVYGDGQTVISVGARHEYGGNGLPRRSFLRLPFVANKTEINKAIAKQFEDVLLRGKPAAQALGLIGVIATNYSKEAFVTRGFGQWPDISQATKDAKGSTQILVNNGILKGSITYVVRSD